MIHVTERLSIIKGRDKPKGLGSFGMFLAGEDPGKEPSAFIEPDIGDIARKQ